MHNKSQTEYTEETSDDDQNYIFSADIDDEAKLSSNADKKTYRKTVSMKHDEYFAHHFTEVQEDSSSTSGKHCGPGCCIAGLKALWATRNRKITRDKQAIIRATLRELIIYLIFLALLLTVALMPTVFLKTYFFTSLVQQFTFPLDSTDEEAFSKIDNQVKMWNYIQGGLMTALYSSTGSDNSTYADGDNRLVGRPRIRQVRVDSVSCSIPGPLRGYLRHCYPNFSPSIESREPMQPRAGHNNTLTKEGWTWRSEAESRIGGVVGTIAHYTGSGYYVDLGTTRQDAKDMLKELFEGLWTDEHTRAIFFDFVLYNANLNLFCIGALLFETPYTGGLISSADFRPLYMIRLYSTTEYITFACELISLVFVMYYLVKEILEMKELGLAYFRHLWNLLDFFVIALAITCVILNIYCSAMSIQLMNSGLTSYGVYPQFTHIGYWSLQYKRIQALLVFFALIQIFKFMSFSETMGQLTATLNYALYDMIGFTFLFAIVFAAFVQAGTLMFGQVSIEFKSFDLTALALYRIILGDFNMEAIKAAHIILGPLYFLIYIFFVFFVLLNMFLAIVGEAYAKVKENMAKRKNDFKFIGYIRHSAKKLVAKLAKKKRMALDEVLQSAGVGDQMELTFSNWRRAMKSAGYSEMESNFLFRKYDCDHDQVLSFLERRRMREDMAMGIAFQPRDSDDEAKEEKNADGDAKSRWDTDANLFVDREDCEELAERIDDAMENVNTAVQQVCLILATMERSERQRRETERALLKGVI